MKNSLSDVAPIVKLIIILGIILASFLIINIIGVVLPIPFIKGGLFSFIEIFRNIDYNNHYHINILKYLQIVQAIGIFVIPPLIIAYIFSDNVRSFLKINNKTNLLNYIIAILIIFACLPLVEWMSEMNSRMQFPSQLAGVERWMKESEASAAIVTKAFLNVTTLKGLALNIFMIAIIPAIGEEFLFRGVFLKLIRDWTKNVHVAVIVSAILFSAIHIQFYGFIPRMMLGILLGYIFVWSGNIWVPVIAHFANNLTAVLLSYFHNTNYITTDPDSMFSGNYNIILIILSIVISALLIAILYFRFRKQKLSEISNIYITRNQEM